MIVTARQLEDLHRTSGGNGHVTLPYRARLTPLAGDFIRLKKLIIGYSDVTAAEPKKVENVAAAHPSDSKHACTCATNPGECCKTGETGATTGESPASSAPASAGGIVWWCDGPCGPAKAAISAIGKDVALRPSEIVADPRQTIAFIRQLARDLKAQRVEAGILLVQNGAVATVYANRCPSIRAVLGTCLDAVEQGIRQVAANVLIIEYPSQTLQQVKNLVGRFARGKRVASEQVEHALKELAACE